MGQRSQIYVRMENIGKSYFQSIKLDDPNNERWRNDAPAYILEMSRYEKWKEAFGDDDTIIICFYHQWMYGRTFVLLASMLLNMNKNLKNKNGYINPFLAINWTDEVFGMNKLPSSVNHNDPLDGIKYLQTFISNIFDFELSKYSRAGIEGFSLFNLDENGETEIFTNFTKIDNNDGVLIFDLITNKYCFVNINGDRTVNKLKYLNPVGAEKYLKAYYPESIDDLSKEQKKSNEIDEATFISNTKINKKFLKRFKGYETLTVDELILIFPEMNNILLKENKKV